VTGRIGFRGPTVKLTGAFGGPGCIATDTLCPGVMGNVCVCDPGATPHWLGRLTDMQGSTA
jgi:hypothetical protein